MVLLVAEILLEVDSGKVRDVHVPIPAALTKAKDGKATVMDHVLAHSRNLVRNLEGPVETHASLAKAHCVRDLVLEAMMPMRLGGGDAHLQMYLSLPRTSA